ncbi:GPI mannosyltransferase 4-like isoform X1 [Biomphalaria glabrata]|nr:GPI mannosyltransferase 4-like isoform X1 [Biomphalaria glabrata]
MNKLSTTLILINFITVLFPQPSYIHPDEFFQSLEIVAGDVLNVTHVRAWEFNESSPVRSIVFPYVLLSPPLYFLKWINSTGLSGFRVSAVKIVIATRLPFAFISLVGYSATERLARAFEVNQYISTLFYSSSYIAWTYLTRTFSNSVEAMLVAFILILIFTCLDCIEHRRKLTLIYEKERKGVHQSNNETKTYERQKGETKKNDAKLNRKDESGEFISEDDISQSAEDDELKNCKLKEQEERLVVLKTKLNVTTHKQHICQMLIGFVITAGFFNRPTFLAFSFVPIIFWFYFSQGFENKIKNILFTGLGALMSCVIIIALDTIYYNVHFFNTVKTSFDLLLTGQFSLNSLMISFELLASSLIITPWNFLKYNMNTANLAEHGLHPHYTHSLVNLPLLIGPLSIPFVVTGISALFVRHPHKNYGLLWLVSMSLFPVCLLSVFPHQEPRFLIPTLPMFLVMAAKYVSGITYGRNMILTVWAMFNLAMVFIYGYLHQAALVPVLSNYQLSVSSSPDSYHHAIFYKTYPPPRSLLIIDPTKQNIRLDDLAGAPTNVLVETVRSAAALCRENKSKCQLSVFLPSTATALLTKHLSDYHVMVSSVCPHFSTEAPPRLMSWWENEISFNEFLLDLCLSIVKVQ